MSDSSQGPGWWQASDGRWYEPQLTPAPNESAQLESVLFNLGDIGISQSWVMTPRGTVAIRGVQFAAQDMTVTTQKTPAYAIVLCIVFIWFFLLSLLFLLISESRTEGAVVVTAQGPKFFHSTTISVTSHQQVVGIQTLVNQANAMASAWG